jgi:hypothetical protein
LNNHLIDRSFVITQVAFRRNVEMKFKPFHVAMFPVARL